MSAILELHWGSDGFIPRPKIAKYKMVALIHAEAQFAFFRSQIAGQIGVIRPRRADGTFYRVLIGDLRLYRRQHRKWRRRASALRSRAAAQLAARSIPKIIAA